MTIKLPVYLVSVLVVLGAIGIYSFPLEEETQNLRLPEADLYNTKDADRYLLERQIEEEEIVPRIPRSVQPSALRYPGKNNGNNRGKGVVDTSSNRRRRPFVFPKQPSYGNKGNASPRRQYDRGVFRNQQRGNKRYNA